MNKTVVDRPYLSPDALIDKIRTYMPEVDEDIIRCAYLMAEQAHDGQERESKDPYFSHPIAVTEILIEQEADIPTLIAGLLHDTVEDTRISLEQVDEAFGEDVAILVDGVTKLDKLEQNESPYEKDEGNLRKLSAYIARDLRVLIVKTADRLHNMRTLDHKASADKRKKKAQETLEIFVNLADFAGLHEWRQELEDLSFRQLDPTAYKTINEALEEVGRASEQLIDLISHKIQEDLAEQGIESTVQGRVKTPYSTWVKLNRKEITLNELGDILAFRVVVKDTPACYQALGVLHCAYSSIDKGFDDYISNPKKSGYRSIHTEFYFNPTQDWEFSELFATLLQAIELSVAEKTALYAPNLGLKIETQIRSNMMHEQAELGDAAHWLYKSRARKVGSEKTSFAQMRGRLSYLQRLLFDVIALNSDRSGFVETFLEETSDQIYILTPRGDLTYIKRGATVLDFAFLIHTEVGLRATGAKLDGRRVPLNTAVVERGHRVEILTSSNSQVSEIWLSWVNTHRARERIKDSLRAKRRRRRIDEGYLGLKRLFHEQGYELSQKALKQAWKVLGTKDGDPEDLLARVGRWLEYLHNGETPETLSQDKDNLSPREVLYAVYPGARLSQSILNEETDRVSKQIKRRLDLVIDQPTVVNHSTLFHFSKCCYPLPGEQIIGFRPTEVQVTIHRTDCPSLRRLEHMKERWVDVSWSQETNKNTVYLSRLRITMLNRVGVLSKVTGIIAREGANIANLRFKERYDDLYVTEIEMELIDFAHYKRLESALLLLDDVSTIERR